MARPLRLLVLADTHLGLDLPAAPRVTRRRRGDDLFDNLALALAPAMRGEVDAVVHGGDLLFRSRVSPALVRRATAPLLALAERGVPVFLVPGNHERSALPYPLLAAHRRLFVFDRPRSFPLVHDGVRFSFTGMPYQRLVGERFEALYAAARDPSADRTVLCLHQAIEGGLAGRHLHRFRAGPEVLATARLPPEACLVLSGHLHRQQVISHDAAGRRLPAPVLYPGSIERISFAERDEEKGTWLVTLPADGQPTWEPRPLPARPMHEGTLRLDHRSPGELSAAIRARLAALPEDSIVRLHLQGEPRVEHAQLLTDATLRALAPARMTVTWARPRARADGAPA